MNVLKPATNVSVSYPPYAKWGDRVKITTLLPVRARDLPVDGFHAFQRSYGGNLDVTGTEDGVRLTLLVQVSTDTIAVQAQKFAADITKSLGFIAAIEPNKK